MKKALLLAAALALAPVSAMAATATTGVDTIQNTDTGTPGGSVGDSFTVKFGTFTSYLPGPGEPAVTTDLPKYHYQFDGTITGVNANVIDYTGTYRLFYDLNNNGADTNPSPVKEYEAGTDTSISSGNATFEATFLGGNTATFTGNLTQTQGPTGPGASFFADLGKVFASATFNGTYAGDPVNPLVGTVQGTLQTTAVPLPAAGWAGLGLLGGLAAWRRRSRRAPVAA